MLTDGVGEWVGCSPARSKGSDAKNAFVSDAPTRVRAPEDR